MLAWVAAPVAVSGQGGGGVLEGVVRDAEKRALAEVKVSLDDQVEGRSQATQTDAAGHFRFGGVGASTYLVRMRKPGYRDGAEGPFAIGPGETKSLNLEMAAEKDSASGKNAALARETASLGAGVSNGKDSAAPKEIGEELPKVAASDFAQNLKVGRELLQA